ncbi:tumor protein p53-inducible nuclear protein 2 isoform X1 [Denticeps clupeoides]|uniref:Tumor protein p53-inducible nuclear protein 2 n=1 Tax=Denticeps clupeoides TaxID=299321 RepID=A0AAY4CH83_9TELE|nr:tumor protein p53-inducible nuclear protein 2 isoform X1 [Denticeps clupeoides]
MFQRLTSLFFGEVEEVSAEVNGPKPRVSDADEEGWLLVSLPEDGECVVLGEGGAEAPSIAQSLPYNECSARGSLGTNMATPPHPSTSTPPLCTRHRTKASRAKMAAAQCPPTSSLSFPVTPSVGLVGVNVLPDSTRCPRGSAPQSPGSRSDRSSSSGLEHCSMEESWFVTPPPCFTAEGATAETSPMEDLLIEHPSMSVYVSPGNLSMVEESAASLAGSMSRMSESAAPSMARSSMPTRVTRGAAAQVGPLAKVTQVSRVQRAKSRAEQRHLSRNRLQRQNRTREQVPRHAGHIRKSFLHQPCQRNLCH